MFQCQFDGNHHDIELSIESIDPQRYVLSSFHRRIARVPYLDGEDLMRTGKMLVHHVQLNKACKKKEGSRKRDTREEEGEEEKEKNK